MTYDDLLAYDLIGLHAGAAAQDCCASRPHAGKTLNARLQVRGFDGIAQLVEAGMGVAVLPQEPAERFTRVFGVRCIRLEEPWAESATITWACCASGACPPSSNALWTP